MSRGSTDSGKAGRAIKQQIRRKAEMIKMNKKRSNIRHSNRWFKKINIYEKDRNLKRITDWPYWSERATQSKNCITLFINAFGHLYLRVAESDRLFRLGVRYRSQFPCTIFTSPRTCRKWRTTRFTRWSWKQNVICMKRNTLRSPAASSDVKTPNCKPFSISCLTPVSWALSGSSCSPR